MKPLVLTPLLLLLTAQLSVAQDFVPGSITLNTGETFSGQIRDGSVKALGSKCQFQRTGETSTTTYTPDKLRGFTLESRRFVPIKPSGVPPRFALILNEGSLSLYSTGDAFYVRPALSDSPLLLVREITATVRGQSVYVKAFRNQLDSLFLDCPSIAGINQRTEYEPRSLSQAIQRYNACQGGQDSFVMAMPKAGKRYGLKAVASSAHLSYATFSPEMTAKTIAYGFGGFVQFLGDKSMYGRLNLQLEAFFLYHKFGGIAGYTQSYVCVPLLVQYAVTAPRTARPYLFLEGGAQIGASVGRKNQGFVLPPASSMAFSLPIGVGIQRGTKASGLNYALSVRYFKMTNTGSNIIRNISLNLSIGL